MVWYFAFFKDGRHRLPGWMEWCMRGNFTHVLAFSPVNNFVQVIDPVAHHIDVSLRIHPQGPQVPIPVEFIALDFALHGGVVVKIVHPVDKIPTSHCLPNFFPGCVTLCKGLLGISDWIFTPYQFYCWLLENGGQLMTEAEQERILENLTGRKLLPEERGNIFRYLGRTRNGKD